MHPLTTPASSRFPDKPGPMLDALTEIRDVGLRLVMLEGCLRETRTHAQRARILLAQSVAIAKQMDVSEKLLGCELAAACGAGRRAALSFIVQAASLAGDALTAAVETNGCLFVRDLLELRARLLVVVDEKSLAAPVLNLRMYPVTTGSA